MSNTIPRVITSSCDMPLIVGYVTSKEIPANTFSLGTTPFAAVGEDVVNVQSMLVPQGVVACPFSKKGTQAVNLQVWTGTGYKMYYYVNDAYIEKTDEEVTGWADGNGDYTTDTIAPGTGYWYRFPVAASTFTLSGEVLNDESVTKNISDSFNLYGNPYPTTLDFEKLTTTVAPPTFSKKGTLAVNLQVWTGSGYKMYYYVSDAYKEASDEEVVGWADGSGDYVTKATADINYGFWVRSPAGAGTITFSK